MTTTSYTTGPITHTVEILTTRELAHEYAATLRNRLPKITIELRRRRTTWIPAVRIAA